MYRRIMPRVYELVDLSFRNAHPNPYFSDWDEKLATPESQGRKKTWLARERSFQRLDRDAWQVIKDEASPYLTKPDANGRGYQQLISILNQTWAYEYLVDLGCSQVTFIRTEKDQKTPDLSGDLNGLRVLCEVKTLGISDDETNRRSNKSGGRTSNTLPNGYFKKLDSAIEQAKTQLESYDVTANSRRIVFIVPDFDDFLGEYKVDYFKEIDQHLTSHPIGGIELAFYNHKTAFHHPISMSSATAINEPD